MGRFVRLACRAKKPLGEGLLHMGVGTAPLCNRLAGRSFKAHYP